MLKCKRWTEVRPKDQSPTAEERRLRAEGDTLRKRPLGRDPSHSTGSFPTHPAPNTASTTIAKTSTPSSERPGQHHKPWFPVNTFCVGRKRQEVSPPWNASQRTWCRRNRWNNTCPVAMATCTREGSSFSIAHFKDLKLNHWVSQTLIKNQNLKCFLHPQRFFASRCLASLITSGGLQQGCSGLG